MTKQKQLENQIAALERKRRKTERDIDNEIASRWLDRERRNVLIVRPSMWQRLRRWLNA